jgi:hypothetical protein
MPPLRSRPFCSELSATAGESLAGTASLVHHWLLVEYRGLWSPDALAGSGLSDQVKATLRRQAAALSHAKVLLIRRRERRDRASLAVFYACSRPGQEALVRLDVAAYDELVDVDFAGGLVPGRLVDHPLFLVCTHGKHDRCCALFGKPLFDVLSDQAEEDWVWQVTHVGGDRFAGNVVVLPEGLYYGRVPSEEAWTLLDEHLARRIHLPRFRGRSVFPFAVQAAEIAVRERYGLVGIGSVDGERADDGTIHVALDGRRFEVELRVEPGPLTYLTCSAERLRHPQRYVVESLRESDV